MTFDRPRLVAREAGRSDQHWDLLLACVAVYFLTSVGRVHQLFSVLEPLRPALLAGALSIVLYVLDGRSSRRVKWSWLPSTKWMIALLAWMILCIPSALVSWTSLDFVIQNFAKTVVMVLVTIGCIRGARDTERLAGAYLVGATLYAVVTLTRFDLTAEWRLGDLYYYDANDLATLLVTAMPIGLYFLHGGRHRTTRALAGLALFVLAVCFLRTGSRGGFLAVIAMGAYVVLRYDAITFRQRAAAGALIAIITLVGVGDLYWTRMASIFQEQDYNRTEEMGRLQIWSRGFGYIRQYPVFGVGPGNFPAAEGTLSSFAMRRQLGLAVPWNAAHNSYLQAGAELGIPGLVLFLGVIARTFQSLSRFRAWIDVKGTRAAELGQALTASLIGFIVGASFLSLAYHEMLYMLVALACALIKTGSISRVAVRTNS